MADLLEQHPLGKKLPPWKPEDLTALGRDMMKKGQLYPIRTYPNPETGRAEILTGWHRYQAAIVNGLDPWIEPYKGDDPAGLIESEDIHRRNLSNADKRKAIADLIAERRQAGEPDLSDREIAKKTGVSKGTVSKVRREVQTEVANGKDGHYEKPAADESGNLGVAAQFNPQAGEMPATSVAAEPPHPRVEASGRKARGRKPTAAKKEDKAETKKEFKPKKLVADRDAWVYATSVQFRANANAAIESIGMLVRDLPTKRELTLKFLSVAGYTLVESGDGLSP